MGSVQGFLDVVAPGLAVGGGARGLEGSFQPGEEDLHGSVQRRGEGGDGEDVGVADGPDIDGVVDGEAGRRGGAGELVGEDGTADAVAADNEAADPGSAGGGYAEADVGGDGVAGAEVLDGEAQVAEDRDEFVLERSAVSSGARYDFGGAGGGHIFGVESLGKMEDVGKR